MPTASEGSGPSRAAAKNCWRDPEAGLPGCAAAAQRRQSGPEGIATAAVEVPGARILLVGLRCRFAGGGVAHGV